MFVFSCKLVLDFTYTKQVAQQKVVKFISKVIGKVWGFVIILIVIRTNFRSSIVQFIFFFWSFEIRGNILRNQKILYV